MRWMTMSRFMNDAPSIRNPNESNWTFFMRVGILIRKFHFGRNQKDRLSPCGSEVLCEGDKSDPGLVLESVHLLLIHHLLQALALGAIVIDGIDFPTPTAAAAATEATAHVRHHLGAIVCSLEMLLWMFQGIGDVLPKMKQKFRYLRLKRKKACFSTGFGTVQEHWIDWRIRNKFLYHLHVVER